MTELAKDVTAIDVTDLLTRYSFDLDGYTVEQLVDAWLHHYPIKWVRLAVIEALYQGRYKAISVEQILNLWQRRGKSLYRFNHEFERIICGRFPGHSTALPRFYHTPPRSPSQPRQATRASTPIAAPANRGAPVSSRSDSSSSSVPEPEPIERPSPNPGSNVESSSAASMPEPIRAETPQETASLPPATDSQRAPVSPFKPSDRLESEPFVLVGIARSSGHREPIHQFVPASEFSDFYAKLKLVAQESVANQDNSPLN